MKHLVGILFSSILLTLVACQPQEAIQPPLENISFNNSGLYPEGIAYNKSSQQFYVSSFYHGKIGTVDLAGNYSDFIDDPELKAALGMHLDEANQILYIATADPGVVARSTTATAGNYAKLLGYDIATQQKVLSMDLTTLNQGAGNFANDLALDHQGNIYVTNSFSPMIFKVDPTNSTATVFAQDTGWNTNSFGLNGLVFHPDNYLLAVHTETGALYKISLDDQSVQQVNAPAVVDGDGLILTRQLELIVVANGVSSNLASKVYKLTSTDGWASATISDTHVPDTSFNFPTTGVEVSDNNYFVVHAKLNEVFAGTAPTDNFLLEQISF